MNSGRLRHLRQQSVGDMERFIRSSIAHIDASLFCFVGLGSLGELYVVAGSAAQEPQVGRTDQSSFRFLSSFRLRKGLVRP